MDILLSFDAAAIAILLISILMGLARGFVREALTVAAFVAAALAALWSLPVFAGLLAEPIGSELIANLIALGSVFLIVYLAVSFVTAPLSKKVREGGGAGGLDRGLGVIFGAVRGMFLLGLLVIGLSAAQVDPPKWMTEARLYPLADQTADILRAMAPEGSRAAETGAAPVEPAPDEPEADEPPVDPIADVIRERSGEEE